MSNLVDLSPPASSSTPQPTFSSLPSTDPSREKLKNARNKVDLVKRRVFDGLAFEVSGLEDLDSEASEVRSSSELWEDYGVVEFLDRKLASPDDSSPDEREEAMRRTLEADTDILEAHGDLTDFLYHVARTKHGKVYIRVVRTLLMNRVLCSERVSQMTKTYNDIEAVTRLLEEKEKDLELTARIGKELLTHNQKLETTVQELENELKAANEKITQLSYEVNKKTELIQVLTNDAEESCSSEAGTPTGFRSINLDVMQSKIRNLEDENKLLRNEFSKIAQETDHCEREEARLVQDIASQLASANMEVDGIAEELGRQKEENRLQHEQIVSLTAKLAETELRLANILTEHDDISTMLAITKENQNALANELAKFKERYAEVVNILTETQEHLKKQRHRSMPTARGGSLFPSMMAAPQPDSIAFELESSLYSEMSLDSGIMADRIPTYKKVFETVKTASRGTQNQLTNEQFPRIGSMTTSTLSSGSFGPRMSSTLHNKGKTDHHGLDSTGQSDSESSMATDVEEYPGPPQPGMPGAPGAADLEAALRRLTPAEVIARRACLSTGTGYSHDYYGTTGIVSPPSFVPHGCRTPDSIMSTGSSGNFSGMSGHSHSTWRIPEKLQIIKPIEGSQTLQHWSHLATPTLGGLLEDRPGVKTKGCRPLEDLGLEIFTLTDVEEDEEYVHPGKMFQDTGSVYTFTNSTVMHPDEHASVTQSLIGSRVASAPGSGYNSGMNTPRATLSRRNSTSTFSTALGLAKVLNERGMKSVAPSIVNTPNNDKNFTPTSTPCNSPDGTPLNSRPCSPGPSSADNSSAFGFLYSGAELIRRTFTGESTPAPTPPPQYHMGARRKRRNEKKPVNSRVVEKLERVGVDSIMATGMSSLALQGALYSKRDSPMAQLTFLRSTLPPIAGSSDSGSSAASTPTDEPRGGITFTAGREERPDRHAGAHRKLSTRQRRPGIRSTRPDLGQVKPIPIATKESTTQSALGTISSLLFGRKGGLL